MAQQQRRLVELDLLRFIAAICVMFYHHLHWEMATLEQTGVYALSRYGDLGVPLFFLISGFVILWSAEGKSLRQFALSRGRRLYPTFWICLCIATVAELSLGKEVSPQRFLANLTMAPAVLHQKPIDGVYWTLLIELKFYVLVGGLLAIGQLVRVEKWLFLWLIASVVAVASQVSLAIECTVSPWSAYFIAGSTLYLMWSRGLTAYRAGMFAACAVLSFASTVSAVDGSWQRAWVVLGTYLVMLTLVLRVWSIPNWRLWAALGAMTYPLYLLHSRPTKALWATMPFPTAIRLMLAAALSLLAAYAVGRLIADGTGRRTNRTVVAVGPS